MPRIGRSLTGYLGRERRPRAAVGWQAVWPAEGGPEGSVKPGQPHRCWCRYGGYSPMPEACVLRGAWPRLLRPRNARCRAFKGAGGDAGARPSTGRPGPRPPRGSHAAASSPRVSRRTPGSRRIAVSLDAQHAWAHDKVMILEGVIVITGSHHWTVAAERNKGEHLLMTRDPGLAQVYTEN